MRIRKAEAVPYLLAMTKVSTTLQPRTMEVKLVWQTAQAAKCSS
jgi:hypothetical protein